MVTTLDILTERLFDYSGTFPPESKTFEEAIEVAKNFEKTLKRPRIVNALFVTEFANAARLAEQQKQLSVSLLGSVFDKDAGKNIEECRALNELQTNVVSYECRITKEALFAQSVSSDIQDISHATVALVAIEPDLSGEEWEQILKKAIQIISGCKEKVSLKFRGTGPTAVGNEKIATIIRQAVSAGVSLKATGGMHHPVIETQYKNNLGFINITAALFLFAKYREKISAENLLSLLSETNATTFRFTPLEMQWNDYVIPLKELQDLKKQIRFSIGSCSLHEPDADLERLYGL